jgi:hypothetical protein
MGRREWLGQKKKKEEKEKEKEKRRKRKGAMWVGFRRELSQMKMKWAARW